MSHPHTGDDAERPDGDRRQLAAVDLGSNSFHLVIARVHGDEVALLDREREQVQLARGLGKHGRLDKRARERALTCLRRFGQRLHAVPGTRVRAVGTNTLRVATNRNEFLEQAEAALGHPIEVISGREEARLIYLGVAHSLPDTPGPRLVVDIGGGSTECILGERFEAFDVHSLRMGCVQLARQYFKNGRISESALDEATLHAASEFRGIARKFRNAGWTQAVGASGTMRAVESVLRGEGWSKDGITRPGLERLREALLVAGHVSRLKLDGLKSARAPVFPGGVAIVLALFDRMKPESLSVSSGALREGVLYDLLGRIRHEDVRERTIRNFQERHRVDVVQAARVERAALALLSHAPREWKLDGAEDGRFLAWAARLHEIGLAVSYSRYHRHGAYLLAHADMPGFSRDDQALISVIVRLHRRKIDLRALAALPPAQRNRARRLVLLLRLAVLLNRSRNPAPQPPFRLQEAEGRLHLVVPARWLAAHPLSVRDLAGERGHLAALDIDLVVPG